MSEHVEELNAGAPTDPRPAAAVVLLRRGGRHDSRGIEVLLGRRTPAARFMPGVWVFPGGAVDPTGTEPSESDYRSTALRELEEEVSVRLAEPAELVEFARWITPIEVKIRFDTRFYLALAPAHSPPEPDGSETVDADWFGPSDALDRHHKGGLSLVFPTIKHLESLLPFANATEALEAARKREVKAVEPRVVGEGDEQRIVLPDELP